MSLFADIADWVASRLTVRRDGSVYPPSAELAVRARQPDGSEVAVFSSGDSLTLVMGKHAFTPQRITPRTALRLGWFFLWTWWVRGTWCGLKLRLWSYCVSIKLDELMQERAR
jgi:hypothetical protein